MSAESQHLNGEESLLAWFLQVTLDFFKSLDKRVFLPTSKD